MQCAIRQREQILGNKESAPGIKGYNLLVIAIEISLLIRVHLKYPNDFGAQFVNFLGVKVERHHQSTSAQINVIAFYQNIPFNQ